MIELTAFNHTKAESISGFHFCRKKSDRLEWMYSAPGHAGVNREDYLLGKAIDKAVDPLATSDEKVEVFNVHYKIECISKPFHQLFDTL